MPSTKEDKYVSNADNLCKSSKKLLACVRLFFLAIFCRTLKLLLLTVNPFALTHLDVGAENFNPAIFGVARNTYPTPSQ